MNQTVEGLVLRAVNLSEDDRILTVLCRELGKISVSAKGARKLKSGLASLAQPFSYSSLELYQGREMYLLRGGENLNSFFRLQEDLASLALAGYFTQLLDYLTDEYQSYDDVLRLVLNCLYALAETEKPRLQIKGAFELRALSECGYMPELTGCRFCGKRDGPMAFSILQGDLCCPACLPRDYRPVPPGILAAMRYCIAAPVEKVLSFSLPDAGLAGFEKLTEQFVLTHLDRSFRGLDFFNSVRDTL